MAALDLIFAKARFAIDFDCVIPTFSDRLHLENARHPLLIDVLRKSKRRVVPFTLTLDRDCRTLLISGPNTGGKTVTLKTVGVIALMAQAGLPVPCSAAELPVFEQVLADIGDNQSIEQNLSTFSAHVSRLREMALDATPDSLVLLDEIGSATDPEEGGALGVALVDHFRAAGAFTVASTHLTALKIYGANTKTVLNASMGFDEQTLEPTYQLQVGLPGKSAGLDIAARLGMPEDIMKRARASLSTQEIELSTLIANLHKRLEETNRLEASLEQRTRGAGRAREADRAGLRSGRKRPNCANWKPVSMRCSAAGRSAAMKLWRGFPRRRRSGRRWMKRTGRRRGSSARCAKTGRRSFRNRASPRPAQTEDRGRNARSPEGNSRTRARAQTAWRRALRSGSGLHEDAGVGRRRGGSAARHHRPDVIEAAEECPLSSRSGTELRPCRRST